MRHGRAKSSRRTLQFYRLNAPHLGPPYRILLDGTFLVASVRNRVPLGDRLAKLLGRQAFACHVARSTLREMEALSERGKGRESSGVADGPDGEGEGDLFARALQYGLDECEIIECDGVAAAASGATLGDGKFEDFSDASRDVYRLARDGVQNRPSYFVATQDEALADALRAVPNVPLFRLGRAVLLLESPSSASRVRAGSAERSKLTRAGGLMTPEECAMVDTANERDRRKRKKKLKEEQERMEKRSREEVGGSFSKRRKGKAKGPNPLSCKSSKKL